MREIDVPFDDAVAPAAAASAARAVVRINMRFLRLFIGMLNK